MNMFLHFRNRIYKYMAYFSEKLEIRYNSILIQMLAKLYPNFYAILKFVQCARLLINDIFWPKLVSGFRKDGKMCAFSFTRRACLIHFYSSSLSAAFWIVESSERSKSIPTRTPLLYRKNGVCWGIPIFPIFAPKRRLWVLNVYPQAMF